MLLKRNMVLELIIRYNPFGAYFQFVILTTLLTENKKRATASKRLHQSAFRRGYFLVEAATPPLVNGLQAATYEHNHNLCIT